MTRRPPGFTLLELLTSIAITIIILLAVGAAITATQTIYQREANMKTAVENGRVAVGYIERITRYLGYGIDPRYAIDIYASNLISTTKSNYIPGATVVDTSTTIAQFITDDFAFRYRDPSYLRRGTYDGVNVTIDNTGGGPATFGITLQTGRLLQVVCSSGQAWAVVKVTTAIAPGANTITVTSANVAADPTSFPTPPTTATAPCLNTAGDKAPYIMLVREVRLRVIPLGTAPNRRPFLVAYNDLQEAAVGTAATDFDPIAADVESFQVSYVMNRAPTGNPVDNNTSPTSGDWILGDATTDTVLIPTAVTDGGRPDFDTPYSSPLRFTADAANVRAVVFDLGLRSLRAEGRRATRQARLADDATAAIAADGYYHTSISTTVRTPNLASRSVFVPPLKIAGDPTVLNDWGG